MSKNDDAKINIIPDYIYFVVVKKIFIKFPSIPQSAIIQEYFYPELLLGRDLEISTFQIVKNLNSNIFLQDFLYYFQK